MAQNPQRIFGDIANQATQRDRETFEQWYLQTYQQKFSWEALFAWKEANKFGLTYKRKKNIKYNEGLGTNGQVFNTDDNLLKYSTVEFEDGIVELDTILTFACKLDPVESDFNPNLWAADIEQAMDTEVAYKRNKILEIINKGTVTTIQGKKADDTNALQIHDEIMDKIYENGFTPSETVILGSADFIRGIRNKLQLQLGTNDQINSVIITSGAMKTVEGTTYYVVPKKLPIINKDGSEETIELLPNGVNAIAFKFSKKYDPLILRKKDHTPLRVGAAALGTGMGNTLIMERVLYLGGAVVEPKGIIKHIITKIDISKINKLDKPTIHVADPTQVTAEQLKPQFKDVVLKAVKVINRILGIQVLALGLSFLTGGVASAVGLGAGLSNFAAAFISFGVETVTDFAVNQIYDSLTSEVTAKNTALNLLPAIRGVGKLTRTARTTRILKLAKKTKLLEKIGVITANNLEDVVGQVTGKKILSDKLIFDFTKQANNETLLYTIGKLSWNDFYKGFKFSNLETINNLLKIEKNIQKISPKLVQKIPRVNEKNANKWLFEYGLNIEKISKINTNEWHNIMTNLHKKGVGKNLLLNANLMRVNANLMRGSKIYNNKLLNILHQTPIKLNKVLNHLNPNFYIQKVTKKLLAPIEKQIITIKQKVISKITDKTKKILSKFETKAIKKGQLLPFAYGSDVFLAVKIVPLSVAGEVALTIYYKNPKYAPIVVMTTLIKAEQFVLAPEPFKFYMNSEWFIGWGFKKTSLFNLVSFAPLAYQQVVKDSFKIYRTIAKILKLQEQFKNNFNKDKLLNTIEENAVTSLLGGGLAFQTYKQFRTKQDLNKTIKSKTLLSSKKFILNKIKLKRNKW